MASRFSQAILKLTGDPAGAERAIDGISARLKGLDRQQAEARVRIRDEGVRTRIDQLQKRLANLSKQEATPAVRIQMGNVVRQLDRLEGQLGGVERQGHRAFEPATHGANALGRAIRYAAAGFVVYGGARGVGSAIRAGFRFNASMESNRVALTQFLGSGQAAQRMLDDLFQTAKRTPFQFEDITSAARKLLAFGFNANEAKDSLQAIGDAVAGLGGGAENIDRIVIALGQIRAKGRVQGDELLQLTEAGIPAYDILAKKLHLTADEVKNIGNQGIPADKAIKALTDGMEERFGKASEAQSKTWAGLTSTLEDDTKQTLGAMTQGLFEQLEEWLPAVNRTADDIAAIWKRDDLDPGQKLKLSRAAVRRNLGPAFHEIEREFKRAHIGEHLQDAVEAAIPKIADGVAHSAPKAAAAFVHGFEDADVWGKLAISAFLYSKLGGRTGFVGMGGRAGKRFGSGFKLAATAFLIAAAPDIFRAVADTVEKDKHGPLHEQINETFPDGTSIPHLGAGSAGDPRPGHGDIVTHPPAPRDAQGRSLSNVVFAFDPDIRGFVRVSRRVADLMKQQGISAAEARKQIRALARQEDDASRSTQRWATRIGRATGELASFRREARRAGRAVDSLFARALREAGSDAGQLVGALHFASGGLIPGTGSSDNVPFRGTPGEFVLRRPVVQAIGLGNLERLNAGGTSGISIGEQHFHQAVPSSDYAAARWERRMADAMRRRGVAYSR